MRLMTTLVALAISLFFAAPLAAQPFNQVIVFGDSNVDSGFYKALPNPGGGATFNGLWASAVSHGAGAPTTNPGLVKSQVLAAHFGLTATPANTVGGTNYASSGAKNVTVNNSQTGGFQQAVPTTVQMNTYLASNSGVANPQALYLVHSGDNDVSHANHDQGAGPYPPDPDAYVTQAAVDLANAVANLQSKGAAKIIVAGLAYDYPLDDAPKRALKLLYTNTLWNTLTSLGVTYIRADINSVRNAIRANPSKYGFVSIGTGAGQMGCTQPVGVGSAWSLLCSSDPAAPSTYTSADAPLTRLFADDSHLGSSGQRIMGNYLYKQVVPGSGTATHDFSGDGKSDLAWRHNSGASGIWLMNGGEVIGSAGLAAIPPSYQVVGQRDFDGDGKADWLWRGTDGNTVMWFLNGTGVKNGVTIGQVPTSWSVAGTGDFNADGKGDILWRDTSGYVAIWLMNGATTANSAVLGQLSTAWTVAGTADFDGDGKADILFRDTLGYLALWLMNGTSVASGSLLGQLPLAWTIVATGDFNGDGKADVLFRDTQGYIAIWLMNGSTVASSGVLGPLSTSWAVIETGDFNGDGKSDILFRDTQGATAIWYMNGVSVAGSANVANPGLDWTIMNVNLN